MKFVYVNVDAITGRVRILDQDEETVLDFLKDDRIANKLACHINIGIIKL